jgi:hypothetical protein
MVKIVLTKDEFNELVDLSINEVFSKNAKEEDKIRKCITKSLKNKLDNNWDEVTIKVKSELEEKMDKYVS